MPLYDWPKDGRLHTRYTELKRCTPGQIQQLVYDRTHRSVPFMSKYTLWGSQWHKEFENESRRTGYTPEIFDESLGGALRVTSPEETIMNEMWDGVVLWSTPDAYSWYPETKTLHIIDYKTSINMDKSKTIDKRQVSLYAAQIRFLGMEAETVKAFYPILVMDEYTGTFKCAVDPIKFEITPEMEEEALLWAEPRVQLLKDHLTPLNEHF